MEIVKNYKKRGPAPLNKDEKRNARVTVFFTKHELEKIIVRAGGKSVVSSYLRAAGLGQSAPRGYVIPPLNRDAWAALSRTASNLNQIVHRLHLADLGIGVAPEIDEISSTLANLRRRLLGQDLFSSVEENEKGEI